MTKSLTTLTAHITEIIEGRRRVRDARFKKLPSDVERVEDVQREAIAYLAERLKYCGFKAVPSQLAISHKVGRMTQVVQLRPCSGNLSGVNVKVSAVALVKSSDFKRWTATEGTKYARELLWSRQIGYLSGANEYFKWQLVDAETRQAELEDLLQKIEAHVLPAFEAWEGNDAIGDAVHRQTEVDRIDWLVEAALWSGNREASIELVRRYLETHPGEVGAYFSEFARFKADRTLSKPMPYPVSGAAYLMARHTLDAA